MKEQIDIEVHTFAKRGKRWPHKHQWVSIHEHPRGGEARFCFMLDDDECDGLEMCLTCLGRRYNSVKESKK